MEFKDVVGRKMAKKNGTTVIVASKIPAGPTLLLPFIYVYIYIYIYIYIY